MLIENKTKNISSSLLNKMANKKQILEWNICNKYD